MLSVFDAVPLAPRAVLEGLDGLARESPALSSGVPLVHPPSLTSHARWLGWAHR
jgi:hypothetical protein